MNRPALLAAGLFLAVSIAAFEATAVITALPTIVDRLHGRSLYGATLAANMLANLIAIVAAGEAADRHGPARPFAWCTGVFVVGLLVAGTAQVMPVVVLGRALQGGGVGGFGALAYVGVRRGFPEDRQPRMYAVLSAGWVLPTLVAPFLAGAITDHLGWRWVFLGIAPLALVAGAVAARQLGVLPRVESAIPHPPTRVPSAVAAAVGVGLFLAGLGAARWIAALPLIVIGIAVGAPALRRLLPGGFWRARSGLAAVVACRLLAAMAFLGIDSFVPLAADRIHHVRATIQGAVIVSASITWTVGQIVSARLYSKVAPRTFIGVGFGLLATGGVLVSPVVRAATPLWFTALMWGLGGLGMGLLFNPTTVFAMGTAGEHDAGLVSGQLNMADSLGFATIGGVGGAIVAASERGVTSLSTALIVTFGIAVTMALTGTLASRRVR